MAKEKDENTTPEKKKPAKEEKSSKADKKADKKNSDKKEQGKVGKWFHDLKVEFKKVVWPTKKTVVTNTCVVVGVISLSAVLVGLLDEGFLAVLRFIYQ
ncbi:MAG: preprotein translocase subunit SecE [Ruminococcus sp.]|nr:preprotein translocase subunit SecE [Ruminococcus sp.]